MVPKDSDNKQLTSIYSDIAIKIGDKDVYHFETQMSNDNRMTIRMIKYDFHYALSTGMVQNNAAEYTIEFPYSAVIYPDSNSKIPDELLCHILFSDGTSHDYRVPTVKIQKYSLEDIKQKHLTIFLPYKLLQFRPRLNSKKAPITEDELTTFISDIIFILEEEMRFNRISKPQYDNYCDLIKKASETVFIKHKAYKDKVVETMTKSSIVLPSARYREYENEIAEKEAIISSTEEELHAAQEEIARLKELLAQANKN